MIISYEPDKELKVNGFSVTLEATQKIISISIKSQQNSNIEYQKINTINEKNNDEDRGEAAKRGYI